MPTQTFPLPFSDYGSTRIDVDQQSRINMFPHTRGGLRQFPGALLWSQDAGVTPQANSSKNFSPGFIPSGIAFNADGTKMYLGNGNNNDDIVQYTLSTAYDPSTASVEYTYTPSAITITSLDGFGWFDSGTKFWIFDNNKAWYSTVSTAYDLSTAATITGSYTFSSQDTDPRGIAIDSTSTYLLMVGNTNDSVYQYEMSTPGDMTTLSYSSKSVSVNITDDFDETTPNSVFWGPAGGNEFYVIGNAEKGMARFDMTTAFDVSTASWANTFGIRSEYFSSTIYQATWANSGNIWAIGIASEVVVFDTESYSLGGENFGEPVFGQTYDGISIAAAPGSVDVNNDGTKVYTMDWGNDQIDEWALSTPYDLSTISGPTSYTFAYVASPRPDGGFRWGNSGAKLYVLDGTTRIIYQYTASTPYSVATLTYDGASLNPPAGTNEKCPVFNSDGTRVYWMDGSENVYTATLSVAWSINSASLDAGNNFAASSIVGSLGESLEVTPDGTTMFISTTAGSVFQFAMSTAHDLTTASLTNVFNPLANSPGGWRSFRLANDGALIFSGHWTSSKGYISKWGLSVANSLANASSSGESIRGALAMSGIPYALAGPSLYSFASTGEATFIGTIPGTSRVHMETDGTQLVICTGTQVFKYTVAGGLVENADADLDDTAATSAYLDLRFHYQQPNGQFVASELNDALNIDPLEFATAESFSDDIVATHAHNQLLQIFGEFSSEIWKTTQTGSPPLRRQIVMERGIIGKFAVSSIDNNLYFVDHTRRLNVMSGLQYQPVPMGALPDEIDTYSTVSDAYINTFAFQNENFVEITFPTAGASWTFHEPSGSWSKREYSSGASIGAAYVEAYGKTLVFSRENVRIFELSDTTYQDNEATLTRTTDTAVIDSNLLGIPEQTVSISRLKVRYDASTSASISVSIARDGNLDSFESAVSQTVSGSGVLTMNRWGRAREFIVRITTSANARVDILSVSADLAVQQDVNE